MISTTSSTADMVTQGKLQINAVEEIEGKNIFLWTFFNSRNVQSSQILQNILYCNIIIIIISKHTELQIHGVNRDHENIL